ncbi:MAG: response regulator [Rhodobacteraceae bacterium]|nr:response regulator [Paracoccaceae bacterium]
MLLVPMIEEGRLFGLVGFDSVRERGDFLPGEVYLLRAYADVIRSVLLRRWATLATRSAQQDLARERAFLHGIVSTSAAGLLVLDESGTIIFANDASEAVLGQPVADLIGQPHDSPYWRISDVNGRPIPASDMPFGHVQNTGQDVANFRIALHCDDGLRYASINAAPISRGGQGPRHVLYAVSDVTDVVEAESAREAALSEARRANEAKSSFLANMSHEIRTPLNGILGIADLLGDDSGDPVQAQLIAILRDSGNLLLNIINDLLDMTKIEADALELEELPFSLSDLARRVEELHTLRASEKHLSFAVTLDDPMGLPRLGDPHRITQILHNLIGNALKFTESGSVDVCLRAPDAGTVTLEVCDTGIGMTEAQKTAVLQPFVQADSSISRRFGGSGLGMSIVRSLTDLFGGTLQIESAPDVGSRVTVTLPLRCALVSDLPEPSPPGRATPEHLNGLHVLAVDDNRTNQMVLSMMLGQLSAQVTLAGDGLAALDLFRAERFDVLILDISMPGMDGLALLKAIRALEHVLGRPRTPAIAYTANAMTHQVDLYRAQGFDACLTKPLKKEQLSQTIVEVLGQVAVS